MERLPQPNRLGTARVLLRELITLREMPSDTLSERYTPSCEV